MEYVIVRYAEKRKVFIDDVEGGVTGQRLRVSRGTHRFDLGEPHDYEPSFRRPTVKNTSSVEPMEVVFGKC